MQRHAIFPYQLSRSAVRALRSPGGSSAAQEAGAPRFSPSFLLRRNHAAGEASLGAAWIQQRLALFIHRNRQPARTWPVCQQVLHARFFVYQNPPPCKQPSCGMNSNRFSLTSSLRSMAEKIKLLPPENSTVSSGSSLRCAGCLIIGQGASLISQNFSSLR